MSVAEEGQETICVMRCGAALYGIPAVNVCEVLEWRSPTPVPLSPPYVAGVIGYKGDVLTVVRLSAVLGISNPADDAAMVVLGGSGTTEQFALAVNSVEQVLSLPRSKVERDPAAVVERSQPMCGGLSHVAGEPVILLKPSFLMPDSLSKSFGHPNEATTQGEPCVV